MGSGDKAAAALLLYQHQPTLEHLADFFSKLREAEENGDFTDDEFLNGLATVEEALWLWAKHIPPQHNHLTR